MTKQEKEKDLLKTYLHKLRIALAEVDIILRDFEKEIDKRKIK